ncbi:MAG: D-glycero-beta-D-manno-heptose-7-phosphate kinase [Chlamydiales bacterium]|nr:D-glycero-beta-D-manno-heptose-7-phosphate kinase [Chlamydiales bacterium]
MVRLVESLNRIEPSKVMLVGDFMLDAYTIGKVKRISPEAPVSVLQVEREEKRPGGAGNAALNLLSLGTEVVVVGRVGDDVGGDHLLQLLKSEGVDTRGILIERAYKTPIKNRIIAENQQMMRVDFESNSSLSLELEVEMLHLLPALMEGVKVVAISDYAKGFLSRKILQRVIELANEQEIPVIVDPKGSDFSKYLGVTIIKPNLSEAILASGLNQYTDLDLVAAKLLKETLAKAFFITRSEAGISLFQREKAREDFPVHAKEVKDVTGAGDTVLAMLTMAIANGFDFAESALLSNIAAGIAIEHFGCARVSLSQVVRRLLHQDSKNKIFDEEHLFALHMAIRDTPFTLLSIDGHLGMTSSIFKSIRELSLNKSGELIVYVRNSASSHEFLSLLASLQEVDFIILRKDNLNHLCRELKPYEIYNLQENKLERVSHLEALT